ncbi:hypothetical protein CK203_029749 [Vitis vinifera]|uniref:SAM domain-containing protein n=1 Tax=Vitis vinifera TaxID=29760 RepID=A0A438IIF3_VITVI|nr:hypothetical protein CK203_029749 [Vitis vinifera]
MVKPKKRQLAALPANKNGAPSGLSGSVNSKTKVDLLGEDRLSQPQAIPQETNTKRWQVSSEACPLRDSVVEREKSTSLGSQRDIQVTQKIPSAQPVSTSVKPPRLYFGRGSDNTEGVGTFKPQRMLGPNSAAKAIKRPTLLHEPINFPIGGVLLNQRMRALNLERKLQRAGGLSRWLALLGLGQFVKIFQRRSVDKFQLINLTMKKLKDMGADAVGPRRKLIHAIDCLCQPYCFEAW